jgi:hypothetical protein
VNARERIVPSSQLASKIGTYHRIASLDVVYES